MLVSSFVRETVPRAQSAPRQTVRRSPEKRLPTLGGWNWRLAEASSSGWLMYLNLGGRYGGLAERGIEISLNQGILPVL